jgi:DNA-binding XRE family transcriptional regulator
MNLKEARAAIKLTQTELAEAAGVSQTTIYDIEVGRNASPSHETVVRLVRALQARGLVGLSVDQLFPVSDVSPADGATS